jgi:hypothetical protein
MLPFINSSLGLKHYIKPTYTTVIITYAAITIIHYVKSSPSGIVFNMQVNDYF